jgi:hypothetical protein
LNSCESKGSLIANPKNIKRGHNKPKYDVEQPIYIKTVDGEFGGVVIDVNGEYNKGEDRMDYYYEVSTWGGHFYDVSESNISLRYITPLEEVESVPELKNVSTKNLLSVYKKYRSFYNDYYDIYNYKIPIDHITLTVPEHGVITVTLEQIQKELSTRENID